MNRIKSRIQTKQGYTHRRWTSEVLLDRHVIENIQNVYIHLSQTIVFKMNFTNKLCEMYLHTGIKISPCIDYIDLICVDSLFVCLSREFARKKYNDETNHKLI